MVIVNYREFDGGVASVARLKFKWADYIWIALLLKLTLFWVIISLISSWDSSCFAKYNVTKINKTIPNYTYYLFDAQKQKISLTDFKDKTIILVFWSTWCASCMDELYSLDILQQDFQHLPFEVVAVAEDILEPELLKEYFQTLELKALKIYYDEDSKLLKEIGVVGIPAAFLINNVSKIRLKFSGLVPWYNNEIRTMILAEMLENYELPENNYKPMPFNAKIKSLKLLARKKTEEKNIEKDNKANPAPQNESSILPNEPASGRSESGQQKPENNQNITNITKPGEQKQQNK